MINLIKGQEFDGHYQLIRLIDTGGFAEVWEAKYLVAGNTVALKIYPRLDEEGAATIEGEYNKLFELQHSNLVNALHFSRYQNYPYLVMRYYPGGNGAGRIGDCHEAEIAKIMMQIGGVLKYLHANDIVHQDIKPNNFLLDQKGNYYLADLGLSLKVRTTIRRFTQASNDRPGGMLSSKQTGLAPAQYRAPELFDQQRSHEDPIKASDIWAFGATLYEMITGYTPFGELGGLMQKEGHGIERLPAAYSDELNRLLMECMAKEAWDRPTASKLEKRAQAFLETGQWYEAQELKQPAGDEGRKTVRRDEREPYREGGGQQGGGGGGQQGGGGGQQGAGGGGKQGGNGAGEKQQKHDAIQKNDKSNFNMGLVAVLVAATLIIAIFVVAAIASRRGGSISGMHTSDSTNAQPSGATNYLDVSNPTIDHQPEDTCQPQLTRVVRDGKELKVYLFLRGCTTQWSLYGPGDPRALYVRPHGMKGSFYQLTNISWTGKDATVPSEGLKIVATFQCPPDENTLLDIREDRNRLDQGLTYITYTGVHLQ